MDKRCDSRFDDSGSELLCLKLKGHEGFDEYGDWEWWDEGSISEAHQRDALLTQDQAIERARLNVEEVSTLTQEIDWRGSTWLTEQLNKLIAHKIRAAQP